MASKQDKAREASKTRPIAQKIHEKIAAKFGDAVSLEDAVDPYTVVHEVDVFIDLMRWLRDAPDMKFDFLRSIAGVDYPDDERIATVYHLYSYPNKHAHVVKYLADREDPQVPTVEGLWSTANWYERENYDLLGIVYTGHSDLRRIMLPDDWVGHPLRKDYAEQADYHGIGTTRPSPLEAFAQMDEARRTARDERGDPVPDVQKSPIKAPDAEPAKTNGAEGAPS